MRVRPILLKRLAALALVGVTSCAVWTWRDSVAYKTEPSAQGRGVVLHDRWRVSPGYNLFTVFFANKRFACEVHDLDGRFVMELAGRYCLFLEDGGYVTSDLGLSRFDGEHRLLWRQPDLEVHHDLFEDPASGEIFVWDWDHAATVNGQKVRGDRLRGFSKDGKPIFDWRAAAHRQQLERLHGEKLRPIPNDEGFLEISHFNSVQILPPNRWEKLHPAFRPGNLLVADARCSCMAILDRQTGKFVWSHHADGETPQQIHTVRLLANGNILYFHNLGPKYSAEVMEIEPLEGKPIWSYRASGPKFFTSPWMGSALRLDNGNTLITQIGGGGSAFEVMSSGRVVWEWRNSDTTPIFRGQIYRVSRIPRARVENLLKTLPPRAGAE